MTSLTFSVARQFALRNNLPLKSFDSRLFWVKLCDAVIVRSRYIEQGVTCNGIAPCYVFGPMIVNALSEAEQAELLEKIPVKKFCTPEEVAHTTDFLVSPMAGFITGEIIDQNGGFQMD